MKGAVLFDLDGTLWDSTAAIVPAWNRVLGKWGKTVTQADMAGIMGLTDREIASRFLPGLPEAEALRKPWGRSTPRRQPRRKTFAAPGPGSMPPWRRPWKPWGRNTAFSSSPTAWTGISTPSFTPTG